MCRGFVSLRQLLKRFTGCCTVNMCSVQCMDLVRWYFDSVTCNSRACPGPELGRHGSEGLAAVSDV